MAAAGASECSVGDCGRPAKTLGRCSGHAERLRLKGVDGGPLGEYRPRPPGCVEDNGGHPCGRPVIAKERCTTHYERLRSGSTFTGPIIRPGRPSLPREERPCRGCGRIVERLRPQIYVLCEDCVRKPAKPHRRYYGRTWTAATRAVRERDGGVCRSCGRTEQEEGRRLATAHIIPFDVALRAGWPEQLIHQLANLILLCAACHKTFDRRPGWAFDIRTDSRPDLPDWAAEHRASDLIEWSLSLLARYMPEALASDWDSQQRPDM
jgi:5-methylcytosine-specific restriction endonuclease McrA